MRLIVKAQHKYTKKYWANGKWNYVYRTLSTRERLSPERATQMKEVQKYQAGRAKLYTAESRKHTFSDLSDKELLREYIETDNDFSRFAVMPNTTKKKLMMTFAAGRAKSVFREMDSRGLGATDAINMLKSKRMPIGTISHGRKKMAEGKWIPVPKGRRKKTLASEHDIQQVRQMFRRQVPGEGREQAITSKHDLDLILTQTTFSMISAGANPSEKLTSGQAKARHEKLLADLKKSGYIYTQGLGQYGAPEDSIFVMTHDANKREMVALGGKYNQESVLFVENGRSQLIGATEDKGKVMMAGTGHSYVPDAEDYYTEFEIAGEKIKFTMNLREIAKALVRMVVRLCKRQAS